MRTSIFKYLGNGECSLQLLSPADLDALRTNTKNRQNRPVGDRRYLLLVYQTTFEKTHYPLSLLPEAIPQQFAPSTIATATINTRLGNGEELHSIVKQLQVKEVMIAHIFSVKKSDRKKFDG